MSAWGVAGGVIGLVALQTVVQPQASARVGGLLGWVAGAMNRLLAADVAGIPDKSTAAGAPTTTSPTGTTGTTGTTPITTSPTGTSSSSTSPVKVGGGPNWAQ